MFTTLIVQPIFNVLSALYALLPGHDFGIAIIIFTLVARWALYPLLKKQLKNTKAMRELQPELKKIKEASKGNKQQESLMMMELYKEKEIKPLSQIGVMIVQIVVFLALFSGLRQVVSNPQRIVDFSYPVVQNTAWMQEVSEDISKFDERFLGKVDLTRAAVEDGQPLYIPALLLVLGSAIIQFLQIKQTLPQAKDGRKLRHILKEAGNGKEADSAEVNAAMGRNLAYFMPGLIFFLTIGFPAALALYW
ncbi:YidC/Oxa1 family membrane protein insertase, partial [Candidatus Saccharibacteria bacterium]|nr:YidC/Oxa1 family membrane protein insertase [Candidatus Saccharibacteria bacterium]